MPEPKARPDFATIGGLLLAVGGIAGGLVMEGGRLRDVAQITSAMIVLGGTIGAVMITTPLSVLIRAGKQLRHVFLSSTESLSQRVEEIIGFRSDCSRLHDWRRDDHNTAFRADPGGKTAPPRFSFEHRILVPKSRRDHRIPI